MVLVRPIAPMGFFTVDIPRRHRRHKLVIGFRIVGAKVTGCSKVFRKTLCLRGRRGFIQGRVFHGAFGDIIRR